MHPTLVDVRVVHHGDQIIACLILHENRFRNGIALSKLSRLGGFCLPIVSADRIEKGIGYFFIFVHGSVGVAPWLPHQAITHYWKLDSVLSVSLRRHLLRGEVDLHLFEVACDEVP